MERMTKHAWKPDVKDGRYGYGRMKQEVNCTFAGCKYKTKAKSTMIIHMATHDGKTESNKFVSHKTVTTPKYTKSDSISSIDEKEEKTDKRSSKLNGLNNNAESSIPSSVKEEMLQEQRENSLLEEIEPRRDFRQPMPNDKLRFSYETLMCCVCEEQFDGKGAKMQRIQHMIYHFREKLKKDINMKDGPPYKCPVAGCTFTAKFDYNWCIHYGRVHGMIRKYEQEYIDENLVKGDTEEERERSREEITKKFHVENIVRKRSWQQAMVTADPKKSVNTAIKQLNPNELSFGFLANHSGTEEEGRKSSNPWVPNLTSHMPTTPGYKANERVFGNVGFSRYQSTPAQSRMANQNLNQPTFGDLAAGNQFGGPPKQQGDLNDGYLKPNNFGYDNFNDTRQSFDSMPPNDYNEQNNTNDQSSYFPSNTRNSYFNNYNDSRETNDFPYSDWQT